MKKLLAMALALLMVAVLLPVTAMAEGTGLPAAVGSTITLEDNVTLASPHDITTDTVLDLGGKTLNGRLNIRNGANVTIKNGTITCPGGQALNVLGTNTGNKTTLTIENDVEITATGGFGVCIFGADYTSSTGASVVNLNGCKITAMAGVFVSGNLQNEDGAVLNINGATIISNPEIAVVVNGKVTVDVNNAFLEGNTALYIKAGTVNINNSTVKGIGDAMNPEPNGNGANSTGDAIVMDSKQGYAGDMKLNIAGGNTITSEKGYALQVANTDVATGTNVTELNITGSTLTGKTNAVKLSEQFVTAVATENSGVTATVTGGTFNGNTTVLEKYLADGKVIRNGKVVDNTIVIITPVSSPVFLSGANQTVAPGSAATFRIDKEFSELQSVAVDGVTLDKSNYKAWSGSTYVELTAAHMKTLAVGTHTLSVYFTGDTATTTFTISKDAAKNPTTGANDFVGAAAALAVVSLLGMAVASRKK